MADYIYLVQMDIPSELEEDFNRIYDTQHIPNILSVEGVSSCTRYKLEEGDTDGVARYLLFMECLHQTFPAVMLGNLHQTRVTGLP